MNILHAHTDPPLLDRLKEMLAGSAKADIAVGYFFISGFGPLAESLSHDGMKRVRILVGHVDKPILEQVAHGLQQADALRAQQERDDLIRRSEREEGVRQAADEVGEGVSLLPQNGGIGERRSYTPRLGSVGASRGTLVSARAAARQGVPLLVREPS